eukprot:364570-Chlamydomonas_euryale.AAC.4
MNRVLFASSEVDDPCGHTCGASVRRSPSFDPGMSPAWDRLASRQDSAPALPYTRASCMGGCWPGMGPLLAPAAACAANSAVGTRAPSEGDAISDSALTPRIAETLPVAWLRLCCERSGTWLALRVSTAADGALPSE